MGEFVGKLSQRSLTRARAQGELAFYMNDLICFDCQADVIEIVCLISRPIRIHQLLDNHRLRCKRQCF